MRRWLCLIFLAVGLLAACNNSSLENEAGEETAVLTLPQLERATLDNGRLRVVATTSIIGDVVAQVGGEAIDLTVLIGAGQDSHSYQPGAQDLTAVAEAHIIFVNGWNLEEGLLDDLENIAEAGILLPVSAGITPLPFSGEDEDEHHHEDPHVWFDPQHVQQWVRNIEQVLAALDPVNSALYSANAAAYLQELDGLLEYMDEQMAQIPPDGRKLVTNHEALAYLAARYDFTLIGTVLPGGSTLAEPSATDLVQLAAAMRAAGTCAIFAETTANTQLAQAAAAELDNCEQVRILSLYTEAIGPPGSETDSYIDMMRVNSELLVEGLK